MAYGLSRALPQRQRTLLTSLAVQPDAVARTEHDIGNADTDDLGDASARIEHEGEHQAIALPDPGIGCDVDHRKHLLAWQEADHLALEALHRHCERVLDHAQI